MYCKTSFYGGFLVYIKQVFTACVAPNNVNYSYSTVSFLWLQGCIVVNNPTMVELHPPKTSKAFIHAGGKIIQTFSFSQVYDELTSQKVLFEDGMLGTIKDFVDGQNCLVFAHGVTSSGKTYTMLGKFLTFFC